MLCETLAHYPEGRLGFLANRIEQRFALTSAHSFVLLMPGLLVTRRFPPLKKLGLALSGSQDTFSSICQSNVVLFSRPDTTQYFTHRPVEVQPHRPGFLLE